MHSWQGGRVILKMMRMAILTTKRTPVNEDNNEDTNGEDNNNPIF